MAPKFKLLLVDDEEELVNALAERLQLRGLESEVALSGEMALQVVHERPPDVMLLDLKMPGMDGLEVLRRVKRIHPGIEIVVLTGHGGVMDRETALRLGAFDYLQKPADIGDLVQVLVRAFQHKGHE